jgi:hypothetical protein
LREKVVIDNVVGSVVSYSSKTWYVRFPTLPDENGDPTVRTFNVTKILKGIENYKNSFE